MAVREIVQIGHEALKKVSSEVEVIDNDIKELIQDLRDTLGEADGIGLAAPQIGVNKRVVLIDFKDGSDEIVLINPVVTKASGKVTDYEGCLSYVMHEGLVERPKKVTVEALDIEGVKRIYKGEDLLARCFCHEIDHLDGIMYTDLASEMYELVEE